MTVFHCDGFEAYGNKADTGANVETRINNTNRTQFAEISGGHSGGNVSLIDDFQAEGLALEFPLTQSARGEWVIYEHPDGTGRHADYKVPTNASVPTLCVGFRFYNAAITPASTITTTIFQPMNGSSSAAFSLRIDANGVDLTLVDNDANTYTASDALSQGTWHYIEVEWKQTTIGNSPFCKVYVDGTLVIDESNIDLAGFTFFETWGMRIGVATSGGNQSDNGEFFAIDDVYEMEIDGVTHTAPLGSCRVMAYRPSSDDVPNDWTPSTGSDNFEMINDTNWGTGDYVDATATGNDDHYGLTADVSPAIDTIHGARIDVACVAVDGTPTLHIGFDDGTADEQSMGVIGTGTDVGRQVFFEVDPSDNPWTETNFNAIEATQRMTE